MDCDGNSNTVLVLAQAAGKGVLPFELYGDLTPNNSASAWQMKATTGVLVRNTNAAKITLFDDIVENGPRYGSSHNSFSTGAMGWYGFGADGRNHVVSLHNLARHLKGSTTGAGSSVSVNHVVPLDDGQSPVAGSSDVLSLTNYPNTNVKSGQSVRFHADGAGGWELEPIPFKLLSPVTSLQATDPNLQDKVTPIAVPDDGGSEGNWTTWHTGTDCPS